VVNILDLLLNYFPDAGREMYEFFSSCSRVPDNKLFKISYLYRLFIMAQFLLLIFPMCFYPVYRHRNNSDGTFARIGSIKGYAGPIGSRTYASLLREARRLFANGAEDVILLGPSPIQTVAPTFSSPESTDLAAWSRSTQGSEREETGVNCS
jgi:hypothetical protein